MKLSDLLTDEKTGALSTTKLWMHIANAILSYVMIRQESVDWELVAAYGAIVGGSYVGSKWLTLKYGGSKDVGSAQ